MLFGEAVMEQGPSLPNKEIVGLSMPTMRISLERAEGG